LEYSCILPDIKIILDFSQLLQLLKHLKKNFQFIKEQKVQFNFR
jgi:hypothetical protein